VGCGQGADAIWLAAWLDGHRDRNLEVALRRAGEATDVACAAVEWVRGDAFQAPLPAGSFDLVSMLDPALPKAAGQAAMRALLATVRSAGLLLAICHDLNDEHRENMKARGTDPADYIGPDDLRPPLGDYFTVELDAIEPRIDPPPDSPHIADVVLRTRRRLAGAP
jgi:hypothetical protein